MSLSPLASQTPGVYIDEINAFPHAIEPVSTSIPAFICYTPKAEYEGDSYLNKPVKINSFIEFKSIFLFSDLPVPASPAQQHSPQYYATKVDVGLGSTISAQDILDGYMNITIKLAIIRPAEFIVIAIRQAMAEAKA